METNLERYQRDLDKLIERGRLLQLAIRLEHVPGQKETIKKASPKEYADLEKKLPRFSEAYQSWYSEAIECLRQLLPSRLQDFVDLYQPDAKRKDITYANYKIADALLGLTVTSNWQEKIVGPDAAVPRFSQQLNILESLKGKFESSLFDIRRLVQADLFDSELDAASELNKRGFARGAGAMAGVVLERHLSQVCDTHKVKITKKNPSINDYNQPLKDSNVIDITQWRFIGHLADLRNLCDHDKKKEPTKEEIEELISGVAKIMKTVV